MTTNVLTPPTLVNQLRLTNQRSEQPEHPQCISTSEEKCVGHENNTVIRLNVYPQSSSNMSSPSFLTTGVPSTVQHSVIVAARHPPLPRVPSFSEIISISCSSPVVVRKVLTPKTKTKTSKATLISSRSSSPFPKIPTKRKPPLTVYVKSMKMYALNLNASGRVHEHHSLLKLFDAFVISNSKINRMGFHKRRAAKGKKSKKSTCTVGSLLLESQTYMESATLEDLSKSSTFQATPSECSCLFQALEMASCVANQRNTAIAPLLECSVMYGWFSGWKDIVGVFSKNKESKNAYSLLHLMKHLMYTALGKTSSAKNKRKKKTISSSSSSSSSSTTTTITTIASMTNAVRGIVVDSRSGKRLWIERGGRIRSNKTAEERKVTLVDVRDALSGLMSLRNKTSHLKKKLEDESEIEHIKTGDLTKMVWNRIHQLRMMPSALFNPDYCWSPTAEQVQKSCEMIVKVVQRVNKESSHPLVPAATEFSLDQINGSFRHCVKSAAKHGDPEAALLPTKIVHMHPFSAQGILRIAFCAAIGIKEKSTFQGTTYALPSKAAAAAAVTKKRGTSNADDISDLSQSAPFNKKKKRRLDTSGSVECMSTMETAKAAVLKIS